MNSFWRFLRDKRNQQVLGWIGGGLVFVATGLWAAFIHFFPLQKPAETKASEQPAASEPAPANVQAECSGIAIGGNQGPVPLDIPPLDPGAIVHVGDV